MPKSERIDASVHERYCAQHRRLERLAETLYAALEARDETRIEQVRQAFEARFRGHLADEEANLVPSLQGVASDIARCIVEEHRRLRVRFVELNVGIELRIASLASVRRFIDELRAHMRVEDRALYRLTDESLAPSRTLFEPTRGVTIASARGSKSGGAR